MIKLMIFLVIGAILFVFIVMTFLNKRRKRLGPADMANVIEHFIEGKGSDWEWDDFISTPIHDPELDKIRIRCSKLDKEFPAGKTGLYTNEHGIEVLRNYIRQLRTV